MSAHRDTPPHPFPAIRVGVVGHRLEALVDSGTGFPTLRATLPTILARIQTAAAGIAGQYPEIFAGPERLRVISPLAEGTDQIVAEEALRLGSALHVPLPCPAATYLSAFQAASQATGEDPRAMFARLLGQA